MYHKNEFSSFTKRLHFIFKRPATMLSKHTQPRKKVRFREQNLASEMPHVRTQVSSPSPGNNQVDQQGHLFPCRSRVDSSFHNPWRSPRPRSKSILTVPRELCSLPNTLFSSSSLLNDRWSSHADNEAFQSALLPPIVPIRSESMIIIDAALDCVLAGNSPPLKQVRGRKGPNQLNAKRTAE